ncbi:hypothetical protein SCOCK_30169 [Actinacidiphila cocklensis]|uniref:Uncharacterized protein n=1 Tax=Actinacidiphila cocklensis TaxID=887465 RepID=A0A9W4DS10_9ACTN|nr:hypothetical protein SCOCK_30169 [Actinacidiphila cocklensis]
MPDRHPGGPAGGGPAAQRGDARPAAGRRRLGGPRRLRISVPATAEIIGTPAEGLWSGGLSEIRSRARPVAPCYGGTSCSRGSQSFDSGAFLRTG